MKRAGSFLKPFISLCIVSFLLTLSLANVFKVKSSDANVLNLPAPTELLKKSDNFSNSVLKGIKINPENPLLFDFIVDLVDEEEVNQEDAQRLINYFMTVLATPDSDIWVNLSPFENDRIINENLEATELGRDMLAQDYMLKQFSSSLTFPEGKIGKKYWEEIKSRLAAEGYDSSSNIDNFTKFWIVPDESLIYEKGTAAYIKKANLKVMHERDYFASMTNGASQTNASTADQIVAEVVNELIIPELEDEVNNGARFSPLRQFYHSALLAYWFKEKFKSSFYKNYIDQNNIKAIELENKELKEKIYSLYVEAYEKGVYDYIKKEKLKDTGNIVKKHYFSGGITKLSSGIEIVKGEELGLASTTARRLLKAAPLKAKSDAVYGSAIAKYLSQDATKVLEERFFRTIYNKSENSNVDTGIEAAVLVQNFLNNTPKNKLSKMLSQVLRKRVDLDQFHEPVQVSYVASGSNKIVYKVNLSTSDGNSEEFVFALNVEKDDGRIQQNEIEDLKWLSTKKRYNLELVPVFGHSFTTSFGKELFVEEFIKGKTVRNYMQEGNDFGQYNEKTTDNLFAVGIALGNSYPKDIHSENFMVTTDQRVKMIDIGNKRFDMTTAVKNKQLASMAEYLFLVFSHYGKEDNNEFILQSFYNGLNTVAQGLELKSAKDSVRKKKNYQGLKDEIDTFMSLMNDYFGNMDSEQRASLVKKLSSNGYLHSYFERRNMDFEMKEQFIDVQIEKMTRAYANFDLSTAQGYDFEKGQPGHTKGGIDLNRDAFDLEIEAEDLVYFEETNPDVGKLLGDDFFLSVNSISSITDEEINELFSD